MLFVNNYVLASNNYYTELKDAAFAKNNYISLMDKTVLKQGKELVTKLFNDRKKIDFTALESLLEGIEEGQKLLFDLQDQSHLVDNISRAIKQGVWYQRGGVIIVALLAAYGAWNVCANLKKKFVKKNS